MSQSGVLSSSGNSGGVPTPGTVNTGDILYGSAPNTLSGLPISTWYGATLGALDTGLPGYLTPNQYVNLVDDFVSGSDFSGSLSILGWNCIGQTNPVLQYNNAVVAGHPGYAGLYNVVAFGYTLMKLSNINASADSLFLGGGLISMNFTIKINQLSSSANRFYVKMGLGNTVNNTDDTASIALKYQDNINGGQWQCVTQNGGIQTTVNTSVAADTNWHTYSIVINAAASSVTFYIDYTAVGTITTNIPTVPVSPSLMFQNTGIYTSGTQTLYFDLFTFYQHLTTAR